MSRAEWCERFRAARDLLNADPRMSAAAKERLRLAEQMSIPGAPTEGNIAFLTSLEIAVALRPKTGLIQ